MKRIGILTFHRAHNYGSVLQAYALQKTIESLGECVCEIIDYIPPNQEKMYALFLANNSIYNLRRNLRRLLNLHQLLRRQKAFERFQRELLVIGEKTYCTVTELDELDNVYDVVVCGSDQIWNKRARDFSIGYFAPGLKKRRKIAYAPSISNGNFEDTSETALIQQALKEFNAISTREYRGKKVLEELIGRNVNIEVVLDPSLLLSKCDYRALCAPRRIKNDYIFFYSIEYNDQAIDIVQEISKKLHMPVVVLYTTARTFKAKVRRFCICNHNAPEDFLSLIRYAKLVVTTSFHGTALSVVFRKNFFSILAIENGQPKIDPRIQTLLSKLDLMDREITQVNWLEKDLAVDIDYLIRERMLEEEEEHSKQFLYSAIWNEI